MAKAVDWNHELIGRYWEYWSKRQDRHSEYFSNRYGDAIVRFMQDVLPLRKRRVLDFGCGPGFLIPHLLASAAGVSGCDTSQEAVALVSKKFAGQQNWEGAALIENGRAPFDDGVFDVATCVETVEHVLDEDLPALFGELRRLVSPDGVIFITTPHLEHIRFNTMYCAVCDHEFHWRQHVRSWTADDLRQRVETAGFEVPFCRGISFKMWKTQHRASVKDLSLRIAWDRMQFATARLLDRVSPQPFPNGREVGLKLKMGYEMHLVAVARPVK